MFCQTSHCYRTKGPKLKTATTIIGCAFVLWSVLTSVQCQDNSYPPRFTTLPVTGGYLVERGNKYIVCKASGYPVPSYRWMRNGVYIRDYSSDGTLRLFNVSRDAAGVYSCQANNTLGAILSPGIISEVAYMDNFALMADSSVSGETGKALVIPLPSINSNPFPALDWEENEFAINDEGERHHTLLNKTLILLDRKLADSGNRYKVNAVNVHASSSFTSPIITATISRSDIATRTAPELIAGPVNQFVTQGSEQVGFECVFNARPSLDLRVVWFKVDGTNRTTLATDSRKYIMSQFPGRRLTITLPVPDDSGTYLCETIMAGFSNKTAQADLLVNVKPQVTGSFPSEHSKDFGQQITMDCAASGIPTPTIFWYFNAQNVSLISDSRYILHGNGSLTVNQIDLEHAGMYQCFVNNVAGEATQYTWLKVNSSPPRLISRPSNVTIIEGSNVRLPCEAQGAPKPTVVWTKVLASGDLVITSSGRYQILENELLITTTEPADSGTYMCNATNSKGTEWAQGTLSIYRRTQISRPPVDLIITKGSPSELPCGVTHDPAIGVQWTWLHKSPTSNSFVEIVPTPRHIINVNGTLSIKQTNSEDIGNYTCQVTSAGGNDSRTVQLNVIELPFAPVIINVALHPTDVRAAVVTWAPSYDGNTPILHFTIGYIVVNDVENTENGWQTFEPNFPTNVTRADITGLKPARRYQFKVVAYNRVGQGPDSEPKPVPGLLMPQQPPSSPPKSFYGYPLTNTTIMLSWQPPDEDSRNGILEGYRIKYKLFGYNDITYLEQNIPSVSVNPQYELTGLAFYQKYSLQIAAYNGEGVGVYSPSYNVSTLEGHPTAPPQNLRLTAFNSTAITVEWKPPNPQFINGINRGYKVIAKVVTLNTEKEFVVPHNVLNPTGVQSKNLTGLLKFTEYTITVQCFTSKGDSPKTPAETIQTLEDVPGEVGSINFKDIRDKSLKVTWTIPDEINGVLTGYTVTYLKKNSSEPKQVVQLPSDTYMYTIYNLTATTKYTISVFASTQVGPGPAKSADIESGVPPDLPEPPHNLAVSNIRERSVLLQFLPGSDGKTSITSWIVEAVEGDNTDFKEIYTVTDEPDARSLHVHNLHPFTTYHLRIIAVNIVGPSNHSLPTRSFQTLQDAPDKPPGNVTVRALNATALRISWTPLSKREWNGDPRGYKVYYKMVDEAVFKMVDLDTGINMDSYILGQLEEWMEYQVKMIAYNDPGVSVDSPITTERTRESVPSEGPVNITSTANSSTSIIVTYGEVPRLSQNGMILGYKVQYRSDEENIPAKLKDVPGGNTTFMTVIQDLRKFVQYEIRVLAFTRMGDGVLSGSDIYVTTHEDLPGPPVIIWFPSVTYTEAEVVWEPPLEPNGIITGYKVSYRLRDSGEPYINSTVLSASTRLYRVDTLQREAYYEFHVSAQTRLGWGTSSAVEVYTMINRRPPESPSKPTIDKFQIKARSISIGWSPAAFNGYGPLRNFTVQYKSDIHSWDTVPEAILPTVNTYTVKGLRPNTPYWFRVAATNDVGTSGYSVMSDEVRTREDAPEGAPQNVTVKPLTTTSVKIMWGQPPAITWNGEILGYTITYRQGQQEVTLPPVAASKHEHVLQSLTEKVNYEFWIIAFNSIGSGPASPPVTVYVGEAAPAAPPIDIRASAPSSTEINVTWNPPPPETQNGELSGYKVYYWLSSDPDSSNEEVIIVREQEVLLKELEIYTDYSIALHAYNLAGDGPRSGIVRQRTGEGVPSVPGAITFRNVTYSSLNVYWLPPKRPNGVILSYELSYVEESSNGGIKQVKFTVRNQNHLFIDNLEANVTYIFSVMARTIVGEGEKNKTRITTGPQQGSPGPPYRPILTVETGRNTLVVRWNQGSEGDMPIIGHDLEMRTQDGKWTLFMKTGNSSSVELNFGLFNRDVEYQFRVKASNNIGIGHPSEASEFFEIPALAKKPFHHEWWFLVIVALAGFIIILVIISFLCLMNRRRSNNKKAPGSATSTSNLAPAMAEPEDGGFGNIEMTRQSRRQTRPFAGIRTGSASAKSSSIYARSPPRPSPASVAYSDDDSNSASKPPLPDDDSQSDFSGKPSDMGDSTEPSDQESDEDSIDSPLPPPPPPVPSSPPPPPFSAAIRNHYINEPVTNSWQQQPPQPNSSFNAYQYTDSEAESSHYAMSLNGGQILMNNTAGSRAPLPGFSSFV